MILVLTLTEKKEVKYLKLLINSLFKAFLWVVRELLCERVVSP